MHIGLKQYFGKQIICTDTNPIVCLLNVYFLNVYIPKKSNLFKSEIYLRQDDFATAWLELVIYGQIDILKHLLCTKIRYRHIYLIFINK
jgi:hypothetical protein